MTEWSVLVTVLQPDSQPPITDEQRRIILDGLPGTDKWIQYPHASGRSHGFETRFWFEGEDAGSASAEATRRYLECAAAAGMDGLQIVLIHGASAEERLSEATIGLEPRQRAAASGTYSVMLRSIAGERVADRSFPRTSLDTILEVLGPDSSGFARDGLVDVRFWVEATDAVDASAVGSARFRAAMASIGKGDWTTVRDQVASVAEASRLAYLGVERHLSTEADPRWSVAIQR